MAQELAGPGGYPSSSYPPSVPTGTGGGGPAGDEGNGGYHRYHPGYEPSAGYPAGMGGAHDGSRAASGGYGRSQWSQGYGGGRGGPQAEATRFAAVRLRGLPFGVRDYEISMFLVGNNTVVLFLRLVLGGGGVGGKRRGGRGGDHTYKITELEGYIELSSTIIHLDKSL